MVSRRHYCRDRGTPTYSGVAGPRACLAFIREIPFGVDYIVILPKLKMNHLITHHLFTTPLLYGRKIQVTYEKIEMSVKGKRWSFIQYICAIEHVKQEKC